VLFNQEKLPLALAVSTVLAHILIAERATQTSDPFSLRDGWRPFGVATRSFALEWHDKPVSALLQYLHDGALLLKIQSGDQTEQALLDIEAAGDAVQLSFGAERCLASVYALSHEKGQLAHVFTAQGATKLVVIDPFLQVAESSAKGGRLTAPMPGKVVSFAVKAGDKVTAGQTLAVMEAMKMEHTIAAPKDGVVAEILYAPGDQVMDGAELLKLAA
jgi:3-methylcrotonyl-CoA carboxylase alpha subunit